MKVLLSETKLTYSALTYNLKILEKYNLTQRRRSSKKPVIIEQTGLGQQTISEG